MQGQQKTDFKSHAFFKHLIGEWKCEGELKAADGNIVTIKEEWKADVFGENTLVMEGKREINGNSQNYKWTIIQNPSTGLYEASHQASTDSADTQRFEVLVPDKELKMEMSGFLGSSNSKVIIVDTFADGNTDVLKSEVTLTDEKGTTTLSGTLTHKREKKP